MVEPSWVSLQSSIRLVLPWPRTACAEYLTLLTGAITPPPLISPGAGAGIMLLDILANERPFAADGEGLIA